MGRAHEVRAKAMAATAAKRSALFNRASKEIYMAAKSGEPDPSMNLALRSAIEKWRGQNVTKEVIDRAIQKAKGGSAESYTQGRYEAFGALCRAGKEGNALRQLGILLEPVNLIDAQIVLRNVLQLLRKHTGGGVAASGKLAQAARQVFGLQGQAAKLVGCQGEIAEGGS